MCPSATVQTARQIDVEVVNLSHELCTEYKRSSVIVIVVFGAHSPVRLLENKQ